MMIGSAGGRAGGLGRPSGTAPIALATTEAGNPIGASTMSMGSPFATSDRIDLIDAIRERSGEP